MIVLDHAVSMEIVKLEILKRRIPSSHIKFPAVVDKLNRKRKGEIGEKSIDFYLDVLPESKYYIFHGLRLLYKHFYFQIDTLLICSQFALILETKYLTGELIFDKNFGQLTHKNTRYKNPVSQARLQAKKLKLWLEDRNIVGLPIAYLFVNTNERSELKSENEQMTRNICNSEFLLDKITQMENAYDKEVLDKKEIRKVNRHLLENHTPKNPDVLKNFNIFPAEILPGVECPKCHYLPMYYKHGKWICSNCKMTDKQAHIQALNDYFLLIKPSITNSELRQFLQIKSPNIAPKILHSMTLPSTGTFRNRTYHQNISPFHV